MENLKKTNHLNFTNVQEYFTLLSNMSKRMVPGTSPDESDHFGGSHPPAESNRDDEKVQK